MSIKKVSIVGTGSMGRGLAHDFALHDYQVVLWGRRRAEQLIHDFGRYIENEVQKKRLTVEEKKKILNNLEFKELSVLDEISKSDWVIESISEHKEEKKKLITLIAEYCPPTTIISSNTSSISLTELSMEVKEKERFLGSHFFSPVPYTELVEVAKTEFTSSEVVEKVTDCLSSLKKTPLLVPNIPGFIFNRLLLALLNEAVVLLETAKGITPAQIDQVFALGWGQKYGPLQLIDLIGIDTVYYCLCNLYDYYKNDKYKPSALLDAYVQNGRLGKKSGQGFYSY